MQLYEFSLEFHLSLFPNSNLQYFSIGSEWHGVDQATNHYLKQWWLDYRLIYASLVLNEFKRFPLSFSDITSVWILAHYVMGKFCDTHIMSIAGVVNVTCTENVLLFAMRNSYVSKILLTGIVDNVIKVSHFSLTLRHSDFEVKSKNYTGI